MNPREEKSLKSNIRKAYSLTFLDGLAFFIPIYIVFLLGKGLSFSQILLLEGAYGAVSVLLEVPTGYFADIKGRKASLIISTIAYIASLALFATGSTFASFAVSMMLWAVAGSFKSGADSAMVYDTLLSLKRQREFPRVISKIGIITMASGAIASLAGGFIAHVNMQLTFLLTAVAAIFSLLVLLAMMEPTREKLIVEKGHLRSLFRIAKAASRNKTFLCLMLYDLFFAPATIVLIYLIQPFVTDFGLPVSVLGAAYAAIMVAAALGMVIAPKFYTKVNAGFQLFSIAALTYLSIILLSVLRTPLSLILFLLIAISAGYVSIIVVSVINQITPSSKRATMLSISSMMSKGLVGFAAVIMGPSLDNFSLRPATLAIALVALVGCIIVSIPLFSLKAGKRLKATEVIA